MTKERKDEKAGKKIILHIFDQRKKELDDRFERLKSESVESFEKRFSEGYDNAKNNCNEKLKTASALTEYINSILGVFSIAHINRTSPKILRVSSDESVWKHFGYEFGYFCGVLLATVEFGMTNKLLKIPDEDTITEMNKWPEKTEFLKKILVKHGHEDYDLGNLLKDRIEHIKKEQEENLSDLQKEIISKVANEFS
ncbi:hypothetical protein ACFL0W_03440 [Nanoarchaeota archaeon]